MGDEAEGTGHDLRLGTVIHIQQHPVCLWKILLKMQHDLRSGPPEPVNGLVVISHHEQILPLPGQQPQNIILNPVHILKLIHEKIPEPVLPGRQDILSLG